MKLWHMHSDLLGGFYASDVYAAGESLTDAVHVALLAYDRWLGERLEETIAHPLGDYCEKGDEGFAEHCKTCRDLFKAELKEKLKPVSGRALIEVRN